MADWSVEILNQVVEAELLALPKDMQARFLRISELLESFGPQQVGMPHVRPLGEKLLGNAASGLCWNRSGNLYGRITATTGCASRIRKKDSGDSAACN